MNRAGALLIFVASGLALGFVLVLILLVVFIPQYNKDRMNAQEMLAIAEMQKVNRMETQYKSRFRKFATSLTQLDTADFASGASKGYHLTLAPAPGGYALAAVPMFFNRTGRRTFYSDQTGILRQNWGQDPATATSLELR